MINVATLYPRLPHSLACSISPTMGITVQGDAGGRLLRFGVFELDLETGEMRKSGVRVHLPPQPVKILALLAGSSGPTGHTRGDPSASLGERDLRRF